MLNFFHLKEKKIHAGNCLKFTFVCFFILLFILTFRGNNCEHYKRDKATVYSTEQKTPCVHQRCSSVCQQNENKINIAGNQDTIQFYWQFIIKYYKKPYFLLCIMQHLNRCVWSPWCPQQVPVTGLIHSLFILISSLLCAAVYKLFMKSVVDIKHGF